MALPYRLDDRYRINGDDRQWILQRLRGEREEREDDDRPVRKGDDIGEELWADVGFFPTVGGCCRSWAQKAARDSDEPLPQALAVVIRRLEEVAKELDAATGLELPMAAEAPVASLPPSPTKVPTKAAPPMKLTTA